MPALAGSFIRIKISATSRYRICAVVCYVFNIVVIQTSKLLQNLYGISRQYFCLLFVTQTSATGWRLPSEHTGLTRSSLGRDSVCSTPLPVTFTSNVFFSFGQLISATRWVPSTSAWAVCSVPHTWYLFVNF